MSNWLYKDKEIATIDDMKPHVDGKPWGFVYLLTLVDKKTKKVKFQYIGKKNLYSITSKVPSKKEFESRVKSSFQRKKMKNGRLKYYDTVIKESNWRDYTSSNTYIKENFNKYDVIKEIILFSTNDSDLTYQEAKEIICQGALESDHFLNDGVSIRRYGKKIIN